MDLAGIALVVSIVNGTVAAVLAGTELRDRWRRRGDS